MLKEPLYQVIASLWLPVGMFFLLFWTVFSFPLALSILAGGATVAMAHSLQMLWLARRLRFAEREATGQGSSNSALAEASSHKALSEEAVTKSKQFLQAYRKAETIKLAVVILMLGGGVIAKQKGPELLASYIDLEALFISVVIFQLLAVIVLARINTRSV